MGIHAHKPWRQVVFIEDRVGVRGGAYWLLTLEPCGHKVARSKAVVDFSSGIILRQMKKAYATAPHKVRCIMCEDDES